MYITTTNSALTLVLEGKEQLFSFKAKVTVPKGSIQTIEYVKKFADWRSMEVRMPGSYVPSWLMAGSFWTENGWDFVYSKKPKGMMRPQLTNVLVIKTDLSKYNRVIIGISQSRALELIEWWNEETKK